MVYKYWTDREHEILKKHYPRGSIEWLMQILGRGKSGIQSRAQAYGIERDVSWIRSGKKNHNWKGGKIRYVCDLCGKEFQRYQSLRQGKNKYCTQKCAKLGFASRDHSGDKNYNWRHGCRVFDIPAICKVCGKRFVTSSGQLERGWGKHCSQECNGVAQVKNQRKSWTDIETSMYRFLLCKYGLAFSPQCHIEGYGVADFYNPVLRMIVECHGDYWHNLPRTKNHDRLKRQFAFDSGYQLVELLGSEIKERF